MLVSSLEKSDEVILSEEEVLSIPNLTTELQAGSPWLMTLVATAAKDDHLGHLKKTRSQTGGGSTMKYSSKGHKVGKLDVNRLIEEA